MSDAKKKQVNVLLVEGTDLAQAKAQASAAGMSVREALEHLGMLSGEIDAARLEQLRALPFVEGVEEQRKFDIGPPDAPTQ